MIAVAEIAPLLRGFGQITPPVVPTLSIVDHGDDTGATAAIGATVPGCTNVLSVQSFDGELGAGQWQSAGTLFGNGSIELDLPAGHYFAQVISTRAGTAIASGVAYFVVTDGLGSLYARCLAAARAKINALSLSGLPADHVLVRKVPLNRAPSGGPLLPAIVLSPHRTENPPGEGTNGCDDVHYDVLVAIFDRDNQEPTLALNLDRHLLWRQQIAKAFRNQRLPGVAEVINAQVEPAEGVLEEAWKSELLASALLVRFTSRESRGLN